MKIKFVEATNFILYGKFMLGLLEREDLARPPYMWLTELPPLRHDYSLLAQEHWPEGTFFLTDVSRPGNGGLWPLTTASNVDWEIKKRRFDDGQL